MALISCLAMAIVMALAGMVHLSAAEKTEKTEKEASPEGRKESRKQVSDAAKSKIAAKNVLFEGLSDREKKRMRKALGEVWRNPAVLEARNALRKASGDYKKALRKAVREVDPELREPMDRILKGRVQQEFVRAGRGSLPLLPKALDFPLELRPSFKKLIAAAEKDPEFKALRKGKGEGGGREKLLKTRRQKAFAMQERLVELAKSASPELIPSIQSFYEKRWPLRPAKTSK